MSTPSLPWHRRWFAGLPLTAQVGWVTLVVALVLALLVHLSAQTLVAHFGASVLPALVVLSVLVTGVAAAVLVERLARLLGRLDRVAQALRCEPEPVEVNFPALAGSQELHSLSISLRRTVETFRRRQAVLVERTEVLGTQLQTRSHQLSTLQDLSIGLASHTELNDLVSDALGALEQTVAYSTASVWAREGLDPDNEVVLMGYRTAEGLSTTDSDMTGLRLSRANLQRYLQIEQAPAPVIENNVRQSLLSWLWALVVDDTRTSSLYRATRSWMAVPLRFHDDVLGVMRIDHQEPNFFDAERARLLTAVGSQAALAMRHTQLQAQGRELAVLHERQRIARDLHDAVSQTLFASQVLSGTLIQTLRRSAHQESPVLINQVQALERLNRAALAEMRLLMYELRPDAIASLPLAEMLQTTIDTITTRGDLVVDQQVSRDVGLPPALRLQLYRIAQEALSNLVRHSSATRARVEWVVHTPDSATLRIADNGVGFVVDEERAGHFGLGNMRSRAEEIGARLTITSQPGEGTEVLVQLGNPPA